MSVRKGSLSVKEIVCRNEPLITKQTPKRFNPLLRPILEIGQGPLADFPAVAPSLAQQDGGGRITIGNDFDVHGNKKKKINRFKL